MERLERLLQEPRHEEYAVPPRGGQEERIAFHPVCPSNKASKQELRMRHMIQAAVFAAIAITAAPAIAPGAIAIILPMLSESKA